MKLLNSYPAQFVDFTDGNSIKSQRDKNIKKTHLLTI